MSANDGPTREEIVDRLAGFAMFGDLSLTELRALAHRFEEAYFNAGEVVMRRGISGSGLYVIVEGRASVRLDGVELNRLMPGDFFGEIALLLDQAPSADVVAETELRCLVLGGSQIEEILIAHPRLMYRMLQAEARKLRNTMPWRS
jgi:cAMP-dependent protein kinase regulator